MDELEVLHTDRTNICFTIMDAEGPEGAEGESWDPVKLASQSAFYVNLYRTVIGPSG